MISVCAFESRLELAARRCVFELFLFYQNEWKYCAAIFPFVYSELQDLGLDKI